MTNTYQYNALGQHIGQGTAATIEVETGHATGGIIQAIGNGLEATQLLGKRITAARRTAQCARLLLLLRVETHFVR